MTSNDLVNRIIDFAATDKHVVTRAGEDYYEQADDLAQLLWGYLSQTYFTILAAKNISAGNQTTNLSVYEAGGANVKPNGWRVKVSVTGGLAAGTYNMLWTGTTYTIGGVALATNDRRLVGESYMILELNKTTGDWIIVEDGTELVYAKYTNSANGTANNIINYQTKVIDKYATVTTGASWKWTCPKSGYYSFCCGISMTNSVATAYYKKGGTQVHYGITVPGNGQGGGAWKEYFVKDEYINIFADVNSNGAAGCYFEIIEQRR